MTSDSLERLSINRADGSPATGQRPARSTTLMVLVIGTIVLIIALYLFISNRPVTIETSTVVQMYPSQSLTLLNASGYVVAQRKAALAAKISGRLEWIGVEEGSRVTAGQVVARLENQDLQAAVRQGEATVHNAQAGLEQVRAEFTDAESSFTRFRQLLSQGIVSQADFDTAQARYQRAVAGVSAAKAGVRTAEAALEGAKTNYDYSLIRAPFDAVVLTKNADVGDIITPLGASANAKAAVVTIADMTSLQVEADVSESNLSQIKKDQPCEIILDALPNSRFRGVLYTIVPTADRTKASVMVKVKFIDQNPAILPEMSAKVAFLERSPTASEQQPRIAIKPSALVQSGNRDGVYLVKEGRVMFAPVTKGNRLGDLVEVSGVRSGDMVAISPLNKLKDGAKISLAEKK